jgi:hypothetical protein
VREQPPANRALLVVKFLPGMDSFEIILAWEFEGEKNQKPVFATSVNQSPAG